jgi:dUTP pyrophosphatase
LSSAEDTIVKCNGGRTLIKTDLRIVCPPGTYLRIAPRSGLAYKFGIDIGAGVIDADYRGPVGIIVFNFGTEDFIVKRGDRIAQAILEQICIPSTIIDVPIQEELPKVGVRGENGFGSTGIAATTTITTDTLDSNKKARIDDETTMISPSVTTDDNNDETMNDSVK